MIVSANLERRNLSKGQQAMALALIYSEPERGRGKKDEARKGAETAHFQYRRVQEARTVLRFSEPQARKVLDGDISLDEALQEVQQAQRKLDSHGPRSVLRMRGQAGEA